MDNQLLVGVLLAVIQSITEYLPISSSGHLALFSNLIGQPNVSFIVFLHLASVLAVIIFTRKQIVQLAKFEKKDRYYLLYLLIGIIPAALVGFFLNDLIEKQFNSLFFVGVGFILTGSLLLMTFQTETKRKISIFSAINIGLIQILALFPGVSRSGSTISMAKLMGVENREAFRFSFLMFIPLAIGASVLNFSNFVWHINFILPFIICLFFSLFFLNLLEKIIIRNKFWIFSFYCFFIGIVTLVLHFLR